ncbi:MULTISPECIES: Gfo/Idh/MocA family protein [Haloarcula]|uniref:Dehydrogenase n=1 Tax=Haloarcula pellucida TaxID=1427151 RepID=A0A830GK75_9EURY|nr:MULTISPECIES: Gfo/Idh/MocA family oxidoreductase [Halomicroarcula]MBX0349795.1 Gfo/Idh/MocA family oxidoreductase [Halomicroarcula pellucida]MDS0279538.1 Gfo/Idh/MocA family oxidoreductase [Halomicroarcula sp. S1AR25-4]GGN94372.1 dehydrogenase [Halomicroarcula pellucida]
MTLDVGFLGYSFMGKAHANALARLPMFFPDAPEVNRSVLVGRTESAVRSAADRLGFDRVETDWADAVDDVDVLYNLGPNHVHVDPTVRALENDVHVFCEKPLAPTLDGAREMAAAAEASDAIAGVAFNYRYLPAIQLAKRLLDAGEFGRIRRFHGQYLQGWQADPDDEWTWRNDEASAGSGAVGDVGAHTIDLARFLVGDLERVSGHLETFIHERPTGDGEREPVTTDDEYSALAAFENGAMGVFEGSRVATGRKGDNTVEVYGSKGGFKFSMERLNELEVTTETTDGFDRILVTEDDHPYMDAWWPTGHIIGWEHTFVHENFEFLSAIADGGCYEPSFDAGLAAQRVVDAIERSHSQETWVSLRRRE